jgi:single-strand DNA-binding protein
MSQEAFATVAGYATADPVFRMTKSGSEVAHVRVACTPRRKDKSGDWQDGDTSYFSVTCWRKLAVAVRASIRKGDPVLVRGRMRTRTWKTEDRMVSEVEIDADAMGHDLTRGWATFNRGSRPPVDPVGPGEEARGEDYAAANPDDPDDGDYGQVLADSGPREPLAPTGAEDAVGILAESALADLTEAEAEADADEFAVPA